MSHTALQLAEKFDERVEQAESGYAIEATGLRVLRDLTHAEWSDIGRELARRDRSTRWALGDWLIRGEGLIVGAGKTGRPSDHDATGSIYSRAMRLTGLTHHTLYKCAVTAQEWPYQDRLADVSLTLHHEALQLPKDRRRPFLLQAQRRRWTAQETLDALREEIRRGKLPPAVGRTWGEGVGKPAPSRGRPDPWVEGIVCPHCRGVIEKAEIRRIRIAGGTHTMTKAVLFIVLLLAARSVSAQTHPCDQPEQTVATKGSKVGWCVPQEDLQAGWKLLINGGVITDYGVIAPIGTPSPAGQYYLEAALPQSGYQKGIYTVQIFGYATEGNGPPSDPKLWQVGGPPNKPQKPRVTGGV